jgi:hypothetical protein
MDNENLEFEDEDDENDLTYVRESSEKSEREESESKSEKSIKFTNYPKTPNNNSNLKMKKYYLDSECENLEEEAKDKVQALGVCGNLTNAEDKKKIIAKSLDKRFGKVNTIIINLIF